MMTGYNEINRYDIHENESVSKNSEKNTVWGWIKRNSELVNIALNIQRSIMADQLFVTDGYTDLKKKHDTLVLTDAYIKSVIEGSGKVSDLISDENVSINKQIEVFKR